MPVHRNLTGVLIAGDEPVVLRSIGGNRDDACLQAQQVNVAAAIQRNAGHLLALDDVTKLRAGGVHLGRGTGDFDRLADGADHKHEVGPVLLVDQKRYAGLNAGLESRRLT